MNCARKFYQEGICCSSLSLLGLRDHMSSHTEPIAYTSQCVLILNTSYTHICTCSHTQHIIYMHLYMFSYSTHHIHASVHVLILNTSYTCICTCSHTQHIIYTHLYMFSYSTHHIHTHLYMFSYSTHHIHASVDVLIHNTSYTRILVALANPLHLPFRHIEDLDLRFLMISTLVSGLTLGMLTEAMLSIN